MEENQNKFKCNGDCLNCRKQPNERREQWQYCAAQFTYNSMRMIGDMQEQLMAMQDTIDNLSDRIEAIQNSESHVFDPTAAEEKSDIPIVPASLPGNAIAQEGDGAIQ